MLLGHKAHTIPLHNNRINNARKLGINKPYAKTILLRDQTSLSTINIHKVLNKVGNKA